jgi:hypothetical protein
MQPVQVIQKKRTEKPEVRQASREAALRYVVNGFDSPACLRAELRRVYAVGKPPDRG